jgi:hypothetical protein
MKRYLLFLPLALAAAVLAEDPADVDGLISKLGDRDYAVREEATKKLVEMGEKAIPALEKALQSEDLEVRVRAGQALRAIRGNGAEEAKAEEPRPSTPTQMRRMSLSMQGDKVIVTITELVDGKEVTKTYEGKSIDELREKYPELRPHLGDGGRLQFQFGVHDDFDMDKFWEDWNKNLDEDMRRWQEEARRDVERMQRWLELFRERPQPRRPDAGFARLGPLLGARAMKPAAVLDAQLGLEGKGLVIEAVEQDSLAARLGLQRFDVLVELNGREIRGIEDVSVALRTPPEGGKAVAKIVRRTQMMTLAEGAAAPK